MKSTCTRCGRAIRGDETIWLDNVKRCYPCFNAEIAERMGVAFDETPVQPFEAVDADGRRHRFEVFSVLCPTGREMIAEERPRRRDGGGYRFAVLGDFEADAWELFQKLYDKARREIAQRHVEYGDLGWQLTQGDRLVGRIESDPNPDGEDLPLLVVDGRAMPWDDVGRMLMSHEGFTLRLQVEDSIEVVGGPLLESPVGRAAGEGSGGGRAPGDDSAGGRATGGRRRQ